MFKYCHSFQLAFTTLILLLAASATVTQQQPVRPQKSVTVDLSQGATFTFKISPNLPDFTFKIIPEPQEKDQYGNAQSTVRDIEVYSGDARKPSQHLTGCDSNEMEPPPAGYDDWFRADDFNFDGYQDIYLLKNWGVTGNQSGCIWLYNPATKTFDFSKEFSALSRLWLDPAEKIILTVDGGGMAGMVHVAEKYRVENNQPVLIWRENQDWDNEKKQFHCQVEERRGKKMVTVRDEWGSSKDLEGPCDASKLFNALPARH